MKPKNQIHNNHQHLFESEKQVNKPELYLEKVLHSPVTLNYSGADQS